MDANESTTGPNATADPLQQKLLEEAVSEEDALMAKALAHHFQQRAIQLNVEGRRLRLAQAAEVPDPEPPAQPS